MTKSSIICESCGQDNHPGATFCIECGVSISPQKFNKTEDLEEPIQSTNKSYQPKTSPSQLKYPRQMMLRGKPRFRMMPIMFIIMIGALIYNFFLKDVL